MKIRSWPGLLLRGLLLGIGMAVPGPSPAKDLRIITSYEAEVVEPMIEAFTRISPGATVRVLNKNTNAAVEELLAGNERGFDLFWASAPEAFDALMEAGRLADLGHGAFADFAYSAVGWAWRSPLSGTVPQDWNDLLHPDFAGRIAMAHPMRSGSTHSLLETVLQDRGWGAGWAWILELAGQLNTIAARSFSVMEGVERGDFDIGLTIDFLALTRSSQGVVFRYGRPPILIPARIAALEGGTEPQAAASFMDFVLSPEGQRLLLRSDIRRIPFDATIRKELDESLLPEIRAALRLSWSRYDPRLAAQRYWEVNQLFDTFVARDFLRRRELWRRLRVLHHADSRDRQRIERLLVWMPITEHQARTAPRNRQTMLAWAERSEGLLSMAEAMICAQEEGP